MNNPNTQPIILLGELTENSYSTAQAFAEALKDIMGIPIDTISVIKGATGEPGQRGQTGLKGQKGDKGDKPTLQQIEYDIATGSKYVDVEYSAHWQTDTYKVRINATIGGVHNFDPETAGVVGIGSIIPVYAEPITTVRVFFTFAGGITSVPSTNHILCVTRLI